VTGPEDASIEAAIPSDGTYLICARELSRGGGPGMYYRLEIRPINPGFTLSADTDVLNTTVGGSAKLKITALRGDYNGPISLALAGDAHGLEFANNVIAEGKNEVEVDVKVKAGESADRLVQLAVIGSATVNGREITQKVSTMTALRKLFPRMPTPPRELDGQLE